MATTSKASSVILAGGISRRLGRDKALVKVGGIPLICRVMDTMNEFARETVVVVNTFDRIRELPLPKAVIPAVDIYPDTGALGGIYTGISESKEEWSFVFSCDMPFINLELLRFMLSVKKGFDIVVPLVDGRPEPTHALYNKSCLSHIQQRIEESDLKITNFFRTVRVMYLSDEDLDRIDPERQSFFNINTQEDLDLANQISNNYRRV